MIKVLHTGDFHVGTNFSSFGDKEKANQLLFKAIENMINYAKNNAVDIILIAGDTFDSHEVEFTVRKRLIDILKNFEKKILICCGNHDYSYHAGIWENIELPSNIGLFGTNEFASFNYKSDVKIFGASFTNAYDKIALPFLDDQNINVGVVHSDILGKSHYNSYTKEAIKESGFTYLAVGHNHTHTGILKSGNTYYSACGSISAISIDQLGEKGFVVAKLDHDVAEFEFVKSNGLEVHEYNFNISQSQSEYEVFSKIKDLSNQNVFAKIKLTGVNSIEADFKTIDLADLFFGYEITDDTKTVDELWKYLNEDSLIGEFTRVLRKQYDLEQNPDILSALELGINALL